MTDYQAARAEATDYLVEADLHLARTGRLPSIPLPADTLRALLAGPPEPSVCPACYRGEVFGLSTDDGFWVEMGSSAGGANPHGMNGWIELIEHHPDGRNVRREYIATDSPLASRPDGWKGIESAPRDGTDVMAGRPVAFGWTPYPLRSRYIDGRWRAQFNERDWRAYDPQPTHWMPLPPAPQPDE